MTNYTFAYASAQAEAPDIGKDMGFARFPEVDAGHPEQTAARRLQPRGQLLLREQGRRLRRRRLPGRQKEPENRGRTRRPAALALGSLHRQSRDRRPTPASPAWSRNRSKARARGRPPPPTRTSRSAVQRSLHPPDKIDPEDTESIYDELKSNLEDAVKREGLL